MAHMACTWGPKVLLCRYFAPKEVGTRIRAMLYYGPRMESQC